MNVHFWTAARVRSHDGGLLLTRDTCGRTPVVRPVGNILEVTEQGANELHKLARLRDFDGTILQLNVRSLTHLLAVLEWFSRRQHREASATRHLYPLLREALQRTSVGSARLVRECFAGYHMQVATSNRKLTTYYIVEVYDIELRTERMPGGLPQLAAIHPNDRLHFVTPQEIASGRITRGGKAMSVDPLCAALLDPQPLIKLPS